MDRIKEIFKMLDVEPEEIFTIPEVKTPNLIYKITPDLDIKYLDKKLNENLWCYSSVTLYSLLSGKNTIKKIKEPQSHREKIAIEYAKLSGYNWIAKNKNGSVTAYYYKPFKKGNYWWCGGFLGTEIKIPISFLSWTDEEPYYIGD